ncbi:glutamate racemase [Neolewinella aurantiaca]|uniref:Glutamate racemase n=1 Tax=Neolewinella aurantiaca TaxID=2602767 RepID=A0A5C7FHC6_9BACT|nr:glutamate racemase [Neolewinella aurantiaca]TXF89177.1 glutamate racemase [Neolewinella aurantiaca]
MTNSPIGIFDSGIGGLSVATAMAELLPEESLLYVADNAYAPYGPRSAESILERSRKITGFLLAEGAKMIVVACNTATSIAIDALREEFPEVPFVGMEPAVKPAAKAGRVGVLATAATLGSSRYLTLRDKHLKGKEVYENACVGLVPLIEEGPAVEVALSAKLASILDPMLAEGVDAIVLGCTHYPLIKDEIQAVCGVGVNIIDPSPAAARQVERLLLQHNLFTLPSETPPGTCGPAHIFMTTGRSISLQRVLLQLANLNGKRKLVVPRVSF